MTEFEKSWQLFCETGNFLAFTRQWENSFPEEKNFNLNNGINVRLHDTGILQFGPQQASQTSLLISSGIHGNETAPMEIVDQMVKDIWSGKLQVKVNLMLIIGNPPAVNISKRFLSQNLNRLFNGKYKNCEQSDYETERAQVIEKAVIDFYNENKNASARYHFDLHTAIKPSQYEKFVLYPFMDGRPLDKQHIEFFGGSDITTVLLGNQPAGTFSYFTSHQFQALSATVELGKVKPFGKNDMQGFSGITKNLELLIKNEAVNKVGFNNDVFTVFKVKQEIIKTNEEYSLHLSDDVKNFTSFKKGTLLASDGKNEKYIVENDGEAIVFPNNNVPVGQRVGVLLERVSL